MRFLPVLTDIPHPSIFLNDNLFRGVGGGLRHPSLLDVYFKIMCRGKKEKQHVNQHLKGVTPHSYKNVDDSHHSTASL